MNTAVLSADKIAFEGVRNFSPALIFDCGQCFRFDVLADGSAEGTVGREHAKISVQGDTVTVDGGQDRELWRRFLCHITVISCRRALQNSSVLLSMYGM